MKESTNLIGKKPTSSTGPSLANHFFPQKNTQEPLETRHSKSTQNTQEPTETRNRESTQNTQAPQETRNRKNAQFQQKTGTAFLTKKPAASTLKSPEKSENSEKNSKNKQKQQKNKAIIHNGFFCFFNYKKTITLLSIACTLPAITLPATATTGTFIPNSPRSQKYFDGTANASRRRACSTEPKRGCNRTRRTRRRFDGQKPNTIYFEGAASVISG